MNSPSHKKYLFFTLLIIYSLTQNCGPSLQNDQMLAGNRLSIQETMYSNYLHHAYNAITPQFH